MPYCHDNRPELADLGTDENRGVSSVLREIRQSRRSCLVIAVALAGAGGAARAQQPDPPPPAEGQAAAADQGDQTDQTAIIPDEEFDASLPPVGEDADAPLGPVSDWEAEAARRGAPAGKDETGKAGKDEAGAGGEAETLGAPLPDDPDLDQPLTPLQAFESEPLDEGGSASADGEKAAELRYRYEIHGLDGLGDEIDPAGVRSRFTALSALEEGDGRAANGAMINARLEQDQKLLGDILSSEGFFDATVHGSLQLPEQGTSGAVTVMIDVAPGPRYRLGDIRFDAPPVIPGDLISRAFLPKTGDPIVADMILGAEANIALQLPQNGYPFVKVGQRDILLDAQTRTGDYTLPVTPGPRSRFGEIVNGEGQAVFQPDHIARIARFRKGDLYDSRMVDDLRKALVSTGLFSVISVEPQESGEAAGDGTQFATLVVNQEPGPPRTLAGQAGYATGEGFKLEGSWTHRNFFPPEGALIGSVTAGTQEQGLGVAFRRSNAGRRDRTVTLGIDALHSDFDAYEAFTGRLYGRISYDSTPIWQKRWTYNYGFELVGTNEQDYDFTDGELRRRTYYLLALPAQLTFDTSNSLLDPTRGFRLSAFVSPETSLGSGAQVYARTTLEGTGYYPVSDDLVLAGRLRVGMIGGAARAQIAPSRRFYAGGGGSVRGFGYQELGPKDPDNRPIGGRSLVEAASEVRYRFGNYGVVAFVDAGQVYTSSLPRFTSWRFGTGIGVRYYTNFGPMRLDVATPIGRKPGESRVAIYISIGQAF